MQRISTETDGVFRNGVRGVQRGTKFNAEWCNAVQEEIAGFIESAGLQLDVNDNGQLVAALLAMLLNPSGVNIKKIIATLAKKRQRLLLRLSRITLYCLSMIF